MIFEAAFQSRRLQQQKAAVPAFFLVAVLFRSFHKIYTQYRSRIIIVLFYGTFHPRNPLICFFYGIKIIEIMNPHCRQCLAVLLFRRLCEPMQELFLIFFHTNSMQKTHCGLILCRCIAFFCMLLKPRICFFLFCRIVTVQLFQPIFIIFRVHHICRTGLSQPVKSSLFHHRSPF